jgi:hypothetical protein
MIKSFFTIVSAFHATGLTAELVLFFCLIAGPMWIFVGMLFVANAAFNNLGMPFLSTLFSWGRATLGTMPLAILWDSDKPLPRFAEKFPAMFLAHVRALMRDDHNGLDKSQARE